MKDQIRKFINEFSHKKIKIGNYDDNKEIIVFIVEGNRKLPMKYKNVLENENLVQDILKAKKPVLGLSKLHRNFYVRCVEKGRRTNER